MSQSRVCAVLLAGGSSTRMNLGTTKQKLNLKGKSILAHALRAFEACPDITDIVLVIRNDETDFAKKESEGISKLRKMVIGGVSRAESAKNGFLAIDFPTDYVAIHDVARCLIRPKMITKVVEDARSYGAASASATVVDTVKRINSQGFAVSTEAREGLRLATTPQIFSYDLYFKAISQVDLADTSITDDNMLMEKIGVSVYMTDVGKSNIKITHAEDLLMAEYILEKIND